MENNKKKNPGPAAYSNTDTRESQAINILRYLLNPKRIKEDIKNRDKVPNHDGQIEIVDEKQVPIGKIDVQVKALAKGKNSISLEVKYIEYSKRTTLPFVFIGVNIEQKKAFWKRLHPNMQEYKEDQEYFTIHFDERTDLIDSDDIYIQKWVSLSKDYQDRIAIFPKLEKDLSNHTLRNISKENCVFAQVLIETINNLLDGDLRIVKDISFHGIWKLGLGLYDLSDKNFNYQLYQIPYGYPDPILVEIDRDKFLFKQINFNAKSSRTISIDIDPVEEGKKIVFKEFRNILENRRLFISGELISREILFSFIDIYYLCLGLNNQNIFKMDDLLYAFNDHLVFLGRVYVETQFKDSPDSEIIPISFDELNIFASKVDLTTIIPLKSEKRFSIHSNYLPLNYIFEALAYLNLNNFTEIIRPYILHQKMNSGYSWHGISLDDEVKNIRKIILNSINEYKSFIIGNNLNFKESDYLNPNITIIYEYESPQIQKNKEISPFWGPMPQLKEFRVKNENQELPKIIFEVKNSTNINVIQNEPYLLINGKKYKINLTSFANASYLFGRTPTLNMIYKMLEEDIKREYGLYFNLLTL